MDLAVNPRLAKVEQGASSGFFCWWWQVCGIRRWPWWPRRCGTAG